MNGGRLFRLPVYYVYYSCLLLLLVNQTNKAKRRAEVNTLQFMRPLRCSNIPYMLAWALWPHIAMADDPLLLYTFASIFRIFSKWIGLSSDWCGTGLNRCNWCSQPIHAVGLDSVSVFAGLMQLFQWFPISIDSAQGFIVFEGWPALRGLTERPAL